MYHSECIYIYIYRTIAPTICVATCSYLQADPGPFWEGGIMTYIAKLMPSVKYGHDWGGIATFGLAI